MDEIEKLRQQNTKLKRLLTESMEDMKSKPCDICDKYSGACAIADYCDFKWRYADEAEEVLKNEAD